MKNQTKVLIMIIVLILAVSSCSRGNGCPGRITNSGVVDSLKS